jgi:hypothetical protein
VKLDGPSSKALKFAGTGLKAGENVVAVTGSTRPAGRWPGCRCSSRAPTAR